MDEYKPNSHKSKEPQGRLPEKRAEKVISGTARVKKKSEFKKIAGEIISEDIHSVKSHIVFDVLVPALKGAISDVFTKGIDMLLYGETGHGRKSKASKVAFTNYSDRDRDYYNRRNYNAYRPSGYDYDDIVLDTAGEAQDVLFSMEEMIESYGVVSVGDFYDLVDYQGNYTDNKYGWTDLRGAKVIRVRDGYVIKLPRALPID